MKFPWFSAALSTVLLSGVCAHAAGSRRLRQVAERAVADMHRLLCYHG
jgi:hypothetical protein